MINAVKTGIPAPSSPIEWATMADGILYTAQIPIKMDGTIESGDIRTRLALRSIISSELLPPPAEHYRMLLKSSSICHTPRTFRE